LEILFLMLAVSAFSEASTMQPPVSYHTIKVDGSSIFYREAGDKNAPVILLLHGFPSSSRMYEPLLQRLGNQFRLIAPDYPGFGHSDWPNPKNFAYTFDHIATVTDHFLEAMKIQQYALYMQDYGGPVGFRLALAHPERIRCIVIQNAVSHDAGLGPNWKVRRQFWQNRVAHETELRSNLLSLETTRARHVGSDPATQLYDPDLWTDELAFLSQPGQADIQTELFYDYRTNVASYPTWQAWMQKNQPRLLVIWGRFDPSFDLSEPESYRRDVPKASIHVLEAGHFALDTKADEIAALVRDFASR
jgi:pimeloyl-ACP methyl ester carboxylesterase